MPPTKRPAGSVTWEEIRSQLDYNPDTGKLYWKIRKPRIHPGMRAGFSTVKGGRGIVVCGQYFQEHRLIWFWMTGYLPPPNVYIDHKNRRYINKWSNLRLATHGQNYVNSKHFGPTRGIQKIREGYYRVRISCRKIRRSHYVDTLRKAKILRNRLERELYGEFACIRR